MKRLALVLLLMSCTAALPPKERPLPLGSGDSFIRGEVIAKDGSALPGVAVTLDGRDATVTDAHGQYKFLRVVPGRHTVRAELAGYGSSTRTFNVPASKEVWVSCTLSASVSESITVTAEAPLIDRHSSGTTTTVALNDVGGYISLQRMPAAPDPYRQIATTAGNSPAYYAPIVENGFNDARKQPATTFSISVDGAAYANVRRFLTEGAMPPPDAVRIEEMVNYFTYAYPEPTDGNPVATVTEVAGCPWSPDHRLVRIGIRGKTVEQWKLAPNNLVFLLDVSGSMRTPDRLPMIKEAMSFLVDQLRGEDSVAIVTYAGAAGVALPSTSGADKQTIKTAIASLNAEGSTNGAAGIEMAYKIAEENFRANANNRIILATDGDFNVGVTTIDGLTKLIESKRKKDIYLTCIGVGTDNLQDGKMELFSSKGNGNYYYLDSLKEAKRVFGTQLTGTLVAVANDVKVQLEFDPAQVASYRQIGYEHRAMENQDFADDAKTAAAIGSGQAVTALYEIIPQRGARRGPIATLRIRYKQPSATKSEELTAAIDDGGKSAYEASPDMQFAAAVAEFGMLLRNSPQKGTASWQDVAALARAMRGTDLDGYRDELLQLVERSSAVRLAAR